MRRYLLIICAILLTGSQLMAATTIITRQSKGSRLVEADMDNNLYNLRNAIDNYITSSSAAILALQQGQQGGTRGYQTQSALNADLSPPANTLAIVTNDPTGDNNTYYIKVGAPGSGSWQKSAMPPQLPMVDMRKYADFAAAVSGQGTTPGTLVLATALPSTTAVTFPSYLRLMRLGGGYLNGTGAVTFEAGSVDYLTPELFGAQGDGVTDDTAAIMRADAAGAAAKIPVMFDGRVYRATQLAPSTHWLAKDGMRATIRHINSGSSVSLVTIGNKTGLTFRNLIFDGDVSADPNPWNSGNYNTFTGARAVYVYSSSYIRFENCTAQNTNWSGFSAYSSNNVSYKNCSTNRTRGNFGDGFYTAGSHDISYEDCVAYDHTRIGFVADVDTGVGSYTITYTRCSASYGHDSSNLYGGQENNAGFWAEGTVDVSYTDCTVSNEKDLGFNAVNLTIAPGGKTIARYSYRNCVVESTSQANPVYGPALFGAKNVSSTVPMHVSYDSCIAKGYRMGFRAQAGSYTTDVATYRGCRSEITWIAGASNICFGHMQANTATARAKFIYRDCTGQFLNPVTADLTGSSSLSGHIVSNDITSPGFNKGDIVIDNCHTASNAEDPIYIKVGPYLNTLADLPNITINNAVVYVTYATIIHDLHATNTVFAGSGNIGTTRGNKIKLENCKFTTGNVTFGGIQVQIINSSVSDGGLLHIYPMAIANGRPSGSYPVAIITGSRFESDISNNKAGLIVGINNESMMVQLTGCTFYNTGSSTSLYPFVYVGSSASVYYNGVYADDTVTYPHGLYYGGGLVTPTGVTKIPMH